MYDVSTETTVGCMFIFIHFPISCTFSSCKQVDTCHASLFELSPAGLHLERGELY